MSKLVLNPDSFQIKASDITKTYNRELIVRNFSQIFSNQESVAITGANGSGKSTLLNILSGIVTPNRGKIEYLINNKSIPEEKWYRMISFCSPAQELIEEFTLKEMLDFHFKFRPLTTSIKREEFLELTYFTNDLNKKIGLFSSGMKQRLKLSLAIFSDSNALFLDEPTTNMDQRGVDWYKRHIIDQANNRLIIIASNQSHEFDFCNKRIDIEKFKTH